MTLNAELTDHWSDINKLCDCLLTSPSLCVFKFVNICWQVKVIQQHSAYRAGQGVFGRPMAIAAAKDMPSHRWWMSFGSQTPELQNIAVKVLSQVTSVGSC